MVEDKMTDVKSKKDDKNIKTLVVEQLPTQPVTRARDEDGNDFNIMTRDEALTEILETVRQLKKLL